MTFSRCCSYRKDTCYYDEYILYSYTVLYVLNKLDGRMTAFKCKGYIWYVAVDKAIYITLLDKTIGLSLKTVRGSQLSIVGTLFTLI